MSQKKTILLLTDFSYEAKGREYFREDVDLSQYLRKDFNVLISHIDDCEKGILTADVILIRNTGPQMTHHRQLEDLKKRKNLCLFNNLQGKGDIKGKQHLRELFQLGFPVIPTFTRKEEFKKFGSFDYYLLKPLNGADSVGVEIVQEKDLLKDESHNYIIQPLVKIEYEVSFYFIGKEFYYSLYTPDANKRWKLKTYNPSQEEIEFALKFIEWNSCEFGIQRVDACRTMEGELLLMELEDYNPFLSLDLLPNTTKEKFLEGLSLSLKKLSSAL